MSYRADDLRPYTAFSNEGRPYTTNNILQDRIDVSTNTIEDRVNTYTNNQLRTNQDFNNVGNFTPVPRPCLGGPIEAVAGAIGGFLTAGPAGIIPGVISGIFGECIFAR